MAAKAKSKPPRKPGQGRKSADGALGTVRVNISIDPASATALRAHGGGNLSVGIRRAAANLKAL